MQKMCALSEWVPSWQCPYFYPKAFAYAASSAWSVLPVLWTTTLHYVLTAIVFLHGSLLSAGHYMGFIFISICSFLYSSVIVWITVFTGLLVG